MSDLDKRTDTTILRRGSERKPPRSWGSWLIGSPLPTADAPHQTVGIPVGLAIFASDALSSTAYASQEILFILAAAGVGAFGYAIPISWVIAALLAIVVLSYEQIIHAYPGGGGAYIVARDNLGDKAALIAGAALLTDYILTVAVSISAGVAEMVSAVPALFSYRVVIAVAMVLIIMIINLRGVREAGSLFAIPTFFFVVMILVTVVVAFFRYLTGTLGTVVNPPELDVARTLAVVTPFLLLHAFSSGTTALTGVEAISNGTTAFKEPRSRNAGITLILMAAILGSLFLSITFLAVKIGAMPAETETVISQLARTAFGGRGVLYLAMIIGTTVILIMAANTSFNGFPRLGAIVAGDGFLPRQFTYRGSRLVHSRGIMLLSMMAVVLIVVFNASVTALIPLYAIGVFLSFTLAQAGMARRWWKIGQMRPGEEVQELGSSLQYRSGWKLRMIINGFGAGCTALVTMVFVVTKFADGAWLVLILTPLLIAMFLVISRHYSHLAGKLSLEDYDEAPPVTRHRIILPIGGVHKGSLQALNYALNLSDDVTAVYVSSDAEETRRLQARWEKWGRGVRLVVLDSPYRRMLEPLLAYLDELEAQRQPNEYITIVVPQFVPAHRWANLLHTQTAVVLRLALMFRPGIIITDVPYHVD
jgi:amino acid transporter